jgi:hypothetical protein
MILPELHTLPIWFFFLGDIELKKVVWYTYQSIMKQTSYRYKKVTEEDEDRKESAGRWCLESHFYY